MKRATALAMVLTPLVWAVSALVAPPLANDDATQLAAVARYPDRWYWFALLTLVGSMLIVPAIAGLVTRARERSPRLAYAGGALAQLGALIAIGDSANQLVTWQMGAPGADRAQMAALLARVDHATGASVVFTVGGLAVMVGMVLLGLALARSAPVWAAALLPVATVLNIVAFGAASRALLLVSYLLLLGALGRLATDGVATPSGARGAATLAPCASRRGAVS
jgi:disulfide bond formation protein DsbB